MNDILCNRAILYTTDCLLSGSDDKALNTPGWIPIIIGRVLPYVIGILVAAAVVTVCILSVKYRFKRAGRLHRELKSLKPERLEVEQLTMAQLTTWFESKRSLLKSTSEGVVATETALRAQNSHLKLPDGVFPRGWAKITGKRAVLQAVYDPSQLAKPDGGYIAYRIVIYKTEHETVRQLLDDNGGCLVITDLLKGMKKR